MCNSIIHHLYTALCAYHPNSNLSPYIDPTCPLHPHINPSPLVTILLSSVSQIKYLFSARITGLKFGLQV